MSDPKRTSEREEQVGVVMGDRVCIGCGYNLTGQRIVREPHYRMLVVRCPECATVAGVQEYPLLGRWASRWGAILAAVWCILLLAAWPASSGAIFGFSMIATEGSSNQFGALLQERMTRDGTASDPFSSPTWQNDFQKWWTEQDPAALFAETGGWPQVARTLLWMLTPLFFFSLGIGWFWSIALLHVRRRWLWLPALAIIGLSSVFAAVALTRWAMVQPTWYWEAARSYVGPRILPVALVFGTTWLLVGLYLGRPLTRLAIRALLPPRLRGALALLWTIDGKTPPGVSVCPARGGSG